MQTLIENVNIINPNDEVKNHQNVLIEDNLIKEISSDKTSTKDNPISKGPSHQTYNGNIKDGGTISLTFYNRHEEMKKIANS